MHPNWGLDQILVSQGYLVFNVNVRGSWGQGKAIRDTHKEFGSLDIDDIESGVRYLVSEGYVDPERVGIWGSSYGGLMTTMSLFKKPGLYAAGIAGAPATNVWHASPEQMRVMGKPEGDDYPERYERQSAVYYASGLEDPLMIIHGTRDATVEYSETVALIEALIANNKVFELVTLPGGNHYWGNDHVEQTRFAYKKMIEFFNRYLDPTRRTE
jgi:dipeptidyl-peptidase-4